jgi:CheY-like chemotaxis protein
MLEKHGYGVVLARHGAHALELLSQISPAAVLLDIEMPTMDGFELLSRLRSDERFRTLPIAMITSRMAERHRQHAMQLGANAYFGKPYREQELLEWLTQCAPVKNPTTSRTRIDQNQILTSAV